MAEVDDTVSIHVGGSNLNHAIIFSDDNGYMINDHHTTMMIVMMMIIMVKR